MKVINWTKFTGDNLGISSEDLMRALSDYFLRSGFERQFMPWYELPSRQSLEELQKAIRDALESGDLFDPSRLDEMYSRLSEMTPQEIDELIKSLSRQLADDGYVTIGPPGEASQRRVDIGSGRAGKDESKTEIRFDLSDKSLDFLGYKTLKDLMGSLGKSAFGRHDTREMATGVETSGSSKPYEFGDTLNLDINGTLLTSLDASPNVGFNTHKCLALNTSVLMIETSFRKSRISPSSILAKFSAIMPTRKYVSS